ncbi:FAD-binding oxidoreductase [Devosia submarina]|uniref:FAD-binding oxidoreductase n=1 Tax=Devosia submarina TaxID=1173082 RepID=UPI001AEC80F9|nr:FAD-binding oxidoreductase [Devosia submarina]
MNLMMQNPAAGAKGAFAAQIDALANRLKGKITLPTHSDYDDCRALALGQFDHRPLLVARVANAPDIADLLDFARSNNLPIAVRSGGHSTCGHGGCEGGVVIDLRALNTLDINCDEMTAWIGTGLSAGEVTNALEKHKLIIGFGDSPTVGVGGLTLGGGVGYFVRKHGLTIDSLLAAELVTANGDILIADNKQNTELFWALRGGGGNFGVVTRFKYRVHQLPEFTGGPMIMPATPEVLAGFVAAAEWAPEELSTILMVMPALPMPFLPPEIVGKTIILAMMAYAGPAASAQAALAPFRALATPLADLVGPAPFSSMYLPEPPGPKPAVSVRTLFMDGMSVAEAGKVLDVLEHCEAPMRMAQVRVLGGAAARIPNDATAYAHRDKRIMTAFLAMDGSPAAAIRHDAWVSSCIKALPQAIDGAYVNFLAAESDRLSAAYPAATWERLRQIKRQYDPENLFRLNQNIPPA